MKKISIAFLLSISCMCALAAVGCKKENPQNSSSSSSESVSDSSSISQTYTVDFNEGEGFEFISETKDGASVAEGASVSFELDVSVFYVGTPVVTANEQTLTPTNNIYTVEVSEDVEISVSGLAKEKSNMVGTGAIDDAFIVSRPVDLLYIAEQVNKGNYAYVTGSYILANDIDCGGEELEVIGDMNNPNAFFSGCFSCVSDSESGKIERYTISNFTINSDDTAYVGLFGTVFADLSVSSSGLFYGIRLENFTINASADNIVEESRSISCGSLVGYGVGVNAFLCDSVNGTINIHADDSYFAFIGGLIGYQQGFYSSDFSVPFPSEVAYSTASVDINVLKGMALYAGGISGYLTTNYPYACTAFVHHSYSTGNVSGALRSGGVVGGMGQFTSVSNCYSTGEIVAKATQSVTDALTTSDEYCTAHAGGIVGFAENDTIVSDCFFGGSVYAYAASGASYQFADSALGGGYEENYVSNTSKKGFAWNCLDLNKNSDKISLADISTLTKQLGWQSYDWELKNDAYPTIFYGTADGAVTASLTLNYVAKNAQGAFTPIKVGDKETVTMKYLDTSTQSSNSYVPIGSFSGSFNLDTIYTADNDYLSYGFYFDEKCEYAIPYSYLPTKDISVYIAFADPTPVLGTYYLQKDNSTAERTLTLTADGIATYSDGVTEQQAYYFYDGKTLTVLGARLSRYYQGEIIIDESEESSILNNPSFDLARYMYYDFTATRTAQGDLLLQDGIYFTQDNPLYAYKTAIHGEYYVKTANSIVYYSFLGNSAIVETVTNGQSVRKVYPVCTVNGNVITLSDGSSDSVTVEKTALSAFDAFKGSWTKSATVNKTYTFDGIGGWEYKYVAYARTGYSYEETVLAQASGSYTRFEDTITFTHNDVTYTAKFDADGMLQVQGGGKTQNFSRENSYTGEWQGNGYLLRLNGIQQDGTGTAILSYLADNTTYELVYEPSETDEYVCLYWPHASYWKNEIFGYFRYDKNTNTLSSVLYDYNAEELYTAVTLFVVDDYVGEWICNAPEFQNVEFSFSGFGLYDFLQSKGTITLKEDRKETEIEYTLDSTLQGKFAYKGKMYTISYDEDGKTVVLSSTAQLERKDRFANTDFVDLSGNSYRFDGKSTLDIGGTFTVNNETYGYKNSGDSYAVYNAQDAIIGSINVTDTHYELKFDSESQARKLYVNNQFIGEWAMSGMFSLLTIGPTDLQGNVRATFKNTPVTMTWIDNTMLTFSFRENQYPYTYYVYVMEDSESEDPVIVLSEYTNLYAGEYIVCSKKNELYGEWTNKSSNINSIFKETITFDGVTSRYAYGTVSRLPQGSLEPIYWNYTISEKGMMMWSQEAIGTTQSIKYFKIEWFEKTGTITNPNVFVNGDKAILLTEVDSLYLVEAKDSSGTTYFFDGMSLNGNTGKMWVNYGETTARAKYSYVIKAYNTDKTITLEATDLDTNKKYEATLNTANTTNIVFTLGAEITS